MRVPEQQLLALALATAVGCALGDLEIAGKACGPTHPCPSGYSCTAAGRCFSGVDGGVPGDNGLLPGDRASGPGDEAGDSPGDTPSPGDTAGGVITFISETHVADNSCEAGTWTLGTFAPGDLGVFWFYGRGNGGTFTEPAAVTRAHDSQSSGQGHIWIGYRVLQAGDTSFAFTSSYGPGSDCATAATVFRGVDPVGNPFEDTAAASYSNECDLDPPAVTTLTNGAMVVTGGGIRGSGQVAPSTPPANYTVTFEVIGGFPDLDGYHRLVTLAGLEDPGPFTVVTDCNNDGRMFTGALRPAL